MELRAGDTIIFSRGNDFWANVLSLALKYIVAPKWDRNGWHMAKVLWFDKGRFIGESTDGGCRVVPMSALSGATVKVYRWLDEEPTREGMELFASDVEDYPYDNFVYVLTIMYYIIKKITFGKIRIPRYKNKKVMCWEYCEMFDTYFGKDWLDPYPTEDPYPLITQFIDCAEYIGEMTI